MKANSQPSKSGKKKPRMEEGSTIVFQCLKNKTVSLFFALFGVPVSLLR